MVFDELRNGLYAEAIRKFVTPDSVVLDLGAGLGIHGLVAAAAGAKRVYLVEPEPVVQIAQEVARANGVDGRIVVMEGTIEELELPEQVDLIVSVMAGNLLFSEDLLPSLFHARDRYLKPGGRLVPDCAELLLAPVSAPDLHARYVSRWSEPILSLDFSPARRFANNEILWLDRNDLPAQAERLAEGAVLSSVDLMTATRADCRGEVSCRVGTSGLCHGLLGWIRMRLGDHWLSTDPYGPEVHWLPALFPLDPPMQLDAAEEVRIQIQRPARGDWTWTVTAQSGTQRHSSFLAHADTARRLRRMAPDHRASLSRRGENALRILEMMREGRTNQDIARALTETESPSPPGLEAALEQVQALALRYASHE